MSGRLCYYKQQQHSKLLAQFVIKVSALRFNIHTKMHPPLTDCGINNALIQFVQFIIIKLYLCIGGMASISEVI